MKKLVKVMFVAGAFFALPALAAQTQINLPAQAPVPAADGAKTYYHAIPATPAVGQAVKIVESDDDTDYIVKVFALKNPEAANDIANMLQETVEAEHGTIRSAVNSESNEAYLIVTAPDFQMPYLEAAINIIDKKGVGFADDGTETLVYAFKHRQGSDLEGVITEAIASGYGSWVFDEGLNQVIYVDNPTCVRDTLEYLPQFDVPTRQVRLECEIVEIEDGDDFNFGLALEAWKEALPESVDMTIDWNKEHQGNNGSPDGWARTIAQNIQLSGMRPKAVANFVNYLIRKGHAKVLSRPVLIVNNGKEAVVESMDNINYKGYNSDPENTLDKQVETGVTLKVVPTLGTESMTLDVEASVNSVVGWTTGGLPIINTRNTVASVGARQGQTLTIAGLRRDFVTKADERVPILGSIPLLGYVFRHEIDVKKSSEIVILMTPYEVTRGLERESQLAEDIKNPSEESEVDKFVRRVILNEN